MSRHHNQTKMSTSLKSVEYYYDIKNVLESYKISYKIINPIRIETQKIKKKKNTNDTTKDQDNIVNTVYKTDITK